MTAEEFYIHDQEKIPSFKCSTAFVRGINWCEGNTNEIAFSKEEMIAFAEGYHKSEMEILKSLK